MTHPHDPHDPHDPHPVRFGAKLVPQGTSIAALRGFWRLADESGFDHLWVYDHLAGVGNAATVAEPDPAIDLYDGWTLLAAMASETRHARLGCMVTANTLRHPAVLAKIATTVDHLSGGRLEFGIGTGWAEYEHRMLALELGGARQRIEKLAEALAVIKALWSSERFTDFAGEHYTLEKAVHAPKPLQRPHPPIWLGGTGEKRMLRLVAEHADVWNMPGGDIYSGSCALDQSLIWRPRPGLPGHRTHVGQLWHVGASTHPGPGLGAGSGTLVAKQLLKRRLRRR